MKIRTQTILPACAYCGYLFNYNMKHANLQIVVRVANGCERRVANVHYDDAFAFTQKRALIQRWDFTERCAFTQSHKDTQIQ